MEHTNKLRKALFFQQPSSNIRTLKQYIEDIFLKLKHIDFDVREHNEDWDEKKLSII